MFFLFFQKGEKGEETVIGAESKSGADSFFADMRADNGTTEAELVTLFEAGKNASRRGGVDEVNRSCFLVRYLCVCVCYASRGGGVDEVASVAFRLLFLLFVVFALSSGGVEGQSAILFQACTLKVIYVIRLCTPSPAERTMRGFSPHPSPLEYACGQRSNNLRHPKHTYTHPPPRHVRTCVAITVFFFRVQASIPISSDLHQLEVMLGGDTGLRGGIDIFAGPPQPIGGRVGGAAASSSSSAAGYGGEGSKAPDDDGEGGPQRGTYTMFDEYGDPGEICLFFVWLRWHG